MESLYLVGIAVLALFALVLAVVLFNFFGLWVRAWIAGAPVQMSKMVGMRLRKVPVGLIVDNRITAVKAGLQVSSDALEGHYLAGGDVSHVVLALIAAAKAGILLDFNHACAIDLATKGTGKTVLEAVRTSINPKVIDAPNPTMGRTTIDGVAQDGIGVKVKARVTVRSHLDRFVGGATEAYMRAMSWGLGQVMGQTARELGFTGQFLSELCDPLVGLEFCCRKLKSALDAHVGQVEDALLRYNGGSDVGYPSRVLSHLATYKV